MTTPTPDVREIAARAVVAVQWGADRDWSQLSESGRDHYLEIADAVLSAVTPVIRQQERAEVAALLGDSDRYLEWCRRTLPARWSATDVRNVWSYLVDESSQPFDNERWSRWVAGIRQQVAEEIEAEIRRQIIAGAPTPLQPGSQLVAGDIVNWLVGIIAAAVARSHAQPEERTDG